MKTYLRHRIYNVIDVKELIALERLDFEGKYRNYRESHDFWEICYTLSGRITLHLEDKQITIPKDHLVLLPPNKMHFYVSEEGNQNQAFVICFDSFSQALYAISGAAFSPDEVQNTCIKTIMEEFSATFCMNENEQMEVLPAPCFGGQQALLLQLEYLLIRLVRRMSVEKNSSIIFFSDANFHADLANAVLRFLRENIHEKITLNDICGKFNYSKSFLCKTFKEQTGETLISCINRLKMEEAQRMLRETKKTVLEIACSLGFKEVKYFDALFKRYVGLTPIAFRGTGVNNHEQKEKQHAVCKEN